MTTNVIVDGQDFGVKVDEAFAEGETIWDVPAAVAQRRAARVTPDQLDRLLPKGQPTEASGDDSPVATALTALKAEATESGIFFTHDGETYSIPRVDDWDLEIFEAVEREVDGQPAPQILRAVRLVLGEKGYARFRSEADPDNPDKRRPRKRTMGDVVKLWEAINAAAGAQPGE